MNIFTQSLNIFWKLALVALAICAFSLTTQAGTVDSAEQVDIELSAQSSEVLQSVDVVTQPCGSELLNEGIAAAGDTDGAVRSLSDCGCCIQTGSQACCDDCGVGNLLPPIVNDRS